MGWYRDGQHRRSLRACNPCIAGYRIERLPRAANQHPVLSVDDRNISSVRLADPIYRISFETVDSHEPAWLFRRSVHRRGPPSCEIENALTINQARDTPCRELPHAVACNQQRAWHLRLQHRPSCHRLCATQNLAELVRVQIVVTGLAHQSPRILAAQSGFCRFEHWLRFRGVGQKIKHACALIALARAKDCRATHEWASRALRKSVVANKSAQPPGLR